MNEGKIRIMTMTTEAAQHWNTDYPDCIEVDRVGNMSRFETFERIQ